MLFSPHSCPHFLSKNVIIIVPRNSADRIGKMIICAYWLKRIFAFALTRDQTVYVGTCRHKFLYLALQSIVERKEYRGMYKWPDSLYNILKEHYSAAPRLKGEKFFDAGELYTVFWSSFEYEVFYNDQAIGSLCPDTNVEIGMTVFLAAKMWRIVEIDNERMRIYVDTASVGDAPIFKGTGGYDVSYEVEKEMSEILFDDEIIHCNCKIVKW